ncbi:hypothetical protein AB6A40_010811 [Gnathostoma spinigerum]|uniref:Uncharacterized protein n=1 Tax=Gnathostoma spinigerum TaxID=75299 RepID=A0ABD6EYE3_9BILA
MRRRSDPIQTSTVAMCGFIIWLLNNFGQPTLLRFNAFSSSTHLWGKVQPLDFLKITVMIEEDMNEKISCLFLSSPFSASFDFLFGTANPLWMKSCCEKHPSFLIDACIPSLLDLASR